MTSGKQAKMPIPVVVVAITAVTAIVVIVVVVEFLLEHLVQ